MDDEEIVRTVAKEMLLHLGHETELSENGKDAIKLYQEAINTNNPFDLVVMDLTIPGGTGLARILRWRSLRTMRERFLLRLSGWTVRLRWI